MSKEKKNGPEKGEKSMIATQAERIKKKHVRKKKDFLKHYSINKTLSAKHIGVTRGTIYNWMKEDPEFKAAVENRTEETLDMLEEEIKRRGFEGQDKEYHTKGGTKVTVREFSDNLAMFYMKGHRPEKYRDNYPVDLTIPIQVNAFLGEKPDGSGEIHVVSMGSRTGQIGPKKKPLIAPTNGDRAKGNDAE